MSQKGSPRFAVEAGLAPILIVLILAFLVGGYLVYQNQVPSTDSGQAKSTSQPSPTSDSITNWKTYTNQEGKFSIKLPPQWQEAENRMSGGVYIGVSLKGGEGEIIIGWEELGGACVDAGYKEIELGNTRFSICGDINKDSQWSWSTDRHGGFVNVSSPVNVNRNIILKILSTFKFTK